MKVWLETGKNEAERYASLREIKAKINKNKKFHVLVNIFFAVGEAGRIFR